MGDWSVKPERHTPLAVLMAGAAALVVGFAVWLFAGWGGPAAMRAVNDIGLLLFALFATGCAIWAARSVRGRQRRAWLWLSVACGGWAMKVAVWAHYNFFRGLDAAPVSALTFVGLLLPIAGSIAMVTFPAHYSRESRARIVLDGIIIEGALFLVSWQLVLDPIYTAGHANRAALTVTLAAAVADVIAVTVAMLVISRARTEQRMALGLLTVGIILKAVSDNAFVAVIAHRAYGATKLISLGWAAAMVTLGIAALMAAMGTHPAPSAKPPRVVPALVWLPYAPLLAAGCLEIIELRNDWKSEPLLATGPLLVMAVLIRQFLVMADNRKLLQKMASQALRDPLTGLANRVLFNDRLAHAVALHHRDQRPVAVLVLDFDDFKLVNDGLGHPVGDALLGAAAQRLSNCVREGDTVARLGGDEFAVVIEGGTEPSHRIARRVVDAFDEPFVLDDVQVRVRPSVGVAVAPSLDPALTADELLKQADVAMYAAKRSRSGAVQIYTPGMQLVDMRSFEAPAKLNGRTSHSGTAAVRLLGELRHAIDHSELTLVYQPQYDLRSGQVIGVEALIRWPHPEHGLLHPDQFLSIVHEHGLIKPVTDLVLTQALADAAQWRRGGVHVPVAVNVFAPLFTDPDLPSWLIGELDNHNLAGDALGVELTEHLLVSDLDRARSVIHSVRAGGIRVALDDFGSGYSALAYLRELPIDQVKLDRDFIAPVLHNHRAAEIVCNVIDLAHRLGIVTVAEGVEDAETAARLYDYGCDVAQGFYCCPPINAVDLLPLLQNTSPCCTPTGINCSTPSADSSDPVPTSDTNRSHNPS